MSFSHIVGHDRPKRLLKAMLNSGRLPHALLFSGPLGVGKRTLALALAQAVNCQSPNDGEPCGECSACGKIVRGTHPDVAELAPEGRLRVIKIEAVRELRKQIGYRPYEGRCKVFIIREADRMQAQGDSAANALLKILEEPPPESLLILTAPTESGLLPTIVSRCLRLKLAPLPRNDVEEWLTLHQAITGPRTRLLAAMAEGCLGRVIDLDPNMVWDLRQEVVDRLHRLGRNPLGDAVTWAEDWAGRSEEWPLLLGLIRFWYRDLMISAGGGARRHLVYDDLDEDFIKNAALRNPKDYVTALQKVEQAEDALNRLIRPEMVFENLLLSLADVFA